MADVKWTNIYLVMETEDGEILKRKKVMQTLCPYDGPLNSMFASCYERTQTKPAFDMDAAKARARAVVSDVKPPRTVLSWLGL